MHPETAGTLSIHLQISRYLAAGGLASAAGEVARAIGEKASANTREVAALSVLMLRQEAAPLK